MARGMKKGMKKPAAPKGAARKASAASTRGMKMKPKKKKK